MAKARFNSIEITQGDDFEATVFIEIDDDGDLWLHQENAEPILVLKSAASDLIEGIRMAINL